MIILSDPLTHILHIYAQCSGFKTSPESSESTIRSPSFRPIHGPLVHGLEEILVSYLPHSRARSSVFLIDINFPISILYRCVFVPQCPTQAYWIIGSQWHLHSLHCTNLAFPKSCGKGLAALRCSFMALPNSSSFACKDRCKASTSSASCEWP